jgi:GntR family transcriptional regulator
MTPTSLQSLSECPICDQISAQLQRISAGEARLPKYRQLSEAILTLIEEGYLKPGDLLPAESLLTDRLPYSLGTVQKSLRSLSELGAVKRTRRRGTIVSDPTSEIYDLWQFRFIDENENTVFPIFSRVLSMDSVNRAGPWSRFLGDGDGYVRIVREIDIDHQFKMHASYYVAIERCGDILNLNPADLEGVHLSAIVQRMIGVTTVRTKNQLVCTTIPDPVCLRLGLPSAARGLQCDILGYGDDDKPLSFQRTYTPADAPPMEFHETKPGWKDTDEKTRAKRNY